jgi:GTP1/Obg family GTP-binding protein
MYEVLEATSCATIGSARDLRLSLLCQLYASTQQGLAIRLRSFDELGVFYKEVLDFLVHMDVLERLISPLPGMLSIHCPLTCPPGPPTFT